MKKYAHAFLCLFILSHANLLAQVNLQTGAAQVNIPLYSFKDAGNRIGLDINLSYVNGNGVKVSDIPSEVGTGWQLNYGGSITRIQNGSPDDQKQTKTYVYPFNNDNEWFNYAEHYFPDGYLYTSFSPLTPVRNIGAYSPYAEYLPERTYLPGTKVRPYKPAPEFLADREQDVFSFSFNGVSGEFVIGKNKAVRTLNDSKLKIEFTEVDITNTNVRTTISEFVIIDEYGIQYVFKEKVLGNVCEYDDIHLYNKNNGHFYGYSRTINDAFTNVMNGRALNQYIVNRWYLSEVKNPATSQKIILNYEAYEVDYKADKIGTLTSADNKEAVSVLWQRNKSINKKLVSIKLSALEKVEFKYYDKIRKDLSSEVFLEKIVLKYSEQEVYNWRFDFKYYTISNGLVQLKNIDDALSAREKQFSRLYLTSIQKNSKGFAVDQPFEFEYNPIGVPLFSMFNDYFGYINVTPTFEPETLDFYTYSDLASLIKNQGYPNRELLDNVVMQGVINKVTYPSGGSLSFDYENNYLSYNSQNVKSGGIRVKSTEKHDGLKVSNKVDYLYNLENGQSSGWGYEPQVFFKTSKVRAYKTPRGRTPAEYFGQAAFTFGLKSISATAGVTSSTIRSRAISANITQELIALVVAVIISKISYEFAPDQKEFTVGEYSSLSISSANPLPHQYSRVDVVEKDQNDLPAGKVVHRFTDPTFHAFQVLALAEPYSQKKRFAIWAYGLPQSIEVYRVGEATPVKTTLYNYSFYSGSLNDDNFLSRKWETKTRLYYYFNVPPGSTTTDIVQETYYPLIGRAELDRKADYNYLSGSTVAVTSSITDYVYSPNNYQIKQSSTTNSKNELVQVNLFYPLDYPGIPIFQTLAAKNIISTLVSTQTSIEKQSIKYVINGNVDEYSLLPNGDIGVIKGYNFRSNLPIQQSQVTVNGSQLLPNAHLYKENISTLYNAQSGLPSQITTAAGERTAIIYNYGNKLPVARISGADISDVAYTSFEDGHGSWNIASEARDNSTAKTGSKSYNLEKGSITRSGLDPGKTYRCTFWATSSASITVGGAQLSHQSGVINGWKLLSYTINGASSVTIGGNNGLIDEVRLYPDGAQMSTKTYRPLIGVTSECDVNNKTTYYLYDESGRLMFVRDQDNNVLKSYCYRSFGQPESCTVYGNNPQSRSFTSNIACGSGLIGQPVMYSVPTNTYYSYTQEGANNQAQSDIVANGQAYANMEGSCVQAHPNDDASGYFYSQNCSQGSEAIYVSIPEGSYFSAVSVEDANNLALQYGQNYANQNGSCISGVNLTYSNYSGTYGYIIQLTNQSTNQSYQFDLTQGSGTIGDVPEGNYNVYIYHPYNPTGYHSFELCNSYFTSGFEANFYYVSLNSSGCSHLNINY